MRWVGVMSKVYDSPRTIVYLSWGEQRPMTLREGHSAPKLCLSMDPSGFSTRSLNSGPDSTAWLVLGAPLLFLSKPAYNTPR